MLKESLLTPSISSVYQENNERPKEMAVTVIQRWWRGRPFASSIKEYGRFNITLRRLQRLPVEAVMELIQSKSLIFVTSKLLHRIRRCPISSNSLNRYKNLAKQFLTAYLMVAHSQEVLTTQTKQEEELVVSGLLMIQSFETWLRKYFNPDGNLFLETFIENLKAFYDIFEVWKQKDNEKIIASMMSHYLEMDRLWITVKDHPAAAAQYEPQLSNNRKELEHQIFKVGGREALTRLFQERQKAREEQGAEEPSPIDDPRNPTSESAASTFVELNDDGSESSDIESETNFKRVQLARIDRQISNILIGFTSEEILTNEQLAHELLLDPEFELTIAKGTELEERVREMATKAFFDTAREEFSQGRYTVWLPQLLVDVKNRLLELVSRQSPIYNEIQDVVDIELITQQVKSGSYDVPKLMKFITQTMLHLCAPVRDQAIREIQEMTDLATVFQRLIEILQDMRLDLANYRLHLLRPVIQEYGIEYEREKFDVTLKAKMVTLERTNTWLREAVKSLKNKQQQTNQRVNSRFELVYYEALVSTVFSMTVVHHENCPETLMLDVDRLYEYQNESQAVTIVAALLMLSKNIVPEFRRNEALATELKDRLFVLLKDPGTVLDNLTVQLIASLTEASPNDSLTPENQEFIRNMVDKTLSSKDPVYALLSRRISEVLFLHLSTGRFPPPEKLVSYGIEGVSAQLQSLSKKLVMLAKHNREVYAHHYNELIRESLREEAE
ncbi:Tcp11-domain-containing protein [Basidiobolus meristosporus CBS 931.73]|uniref:Tcp11-domain-containing protein n=1 Tax=Basidiobolus meristosporus CBS 931.73 TaxID=1314790 RepID=A0A1Y1Y5J5_9FUNG|nr:Tcp11-domain-containing protein [Basidiobolus meristosporus CBS 931.73]|eukprot:ORX93301.1 Tcp11-domain-containing protein [Basidiobolus meristosporus CBS 931.73]